VAAVDDEVGTLMSSGTHHRELMHYLRENGVRSMAHDGLEKVAMGVTSMDELGRVCGFTPCSELPTESPELETVAT
jgi:type II secretory ATPase GspE/PulE/Tfp pilus assembly ATPase PilB-like protein